MVTKEVVMCSENKLLPKLEVSIFFPYAQSPKLLLRLREMYDTNGPDGLERRDQPQQEMSRFPKRVIYDTYMDPISWSEKIGCTKKLFLTFVDLTLWIEPLLIDEN